MKGVTWLKILSHNPQLFFFRLPWVYNYDFDYFLFNDFFTKKTKKRTFAPPVGQKCYCCGVEERMLQGTKNIIKNQRKLLFQQNVVNNVKQIIFLLIINKSS